MVHSRRLLASNFRLAPRAGILHRALAVLAVAAVVAAALAASPRGPSGSHSTARASRLTGGAKMAVTYHVVVAFDPDKEGQLKPGEACEVTNAPTAERTARNLSHQHAGAVAFSRSGDPATAEFEDAAILAQFGAVDLEAMSV